MASDPGELPTELFQKLQKELDHIQEFLRDRSHNPNIGRFIRFPKYQDKLDEIRRLIDKNIEQFEKHFDEDDRRMGEIDIALSAFQSVAPVSPCPIPAYSC
jgi:DNA repair exonuclease SbcCD ATPase subunit